MQYFPIFVDLKDQKCLVVGGGEIALRKIRLMRSAGAQITVVAPELCSDLSNEFGAQIEHYKREFQKNDIADYRLITAATNNSAVNLQVSELAKAVNIPVNVVDQPDLCSFITPSIVDRSPVQIAISTGGGAPVLARSIRSKLESMIPAGYGHLAELMDRFRDRVKLKFSKEDDRRRFWENITNGKISEKVFSGQVDQAQLLLEQAIEKKNFNQQIGDVALVGAGPGDPDLLTFRALRLMQQADIVLYDRLVSDDIMNLVRRDADRVYVGKRRSEHAVQQADINQLLADYALAGKRVVRLKGGDPFIFGRGGEEIELLAELGIPFQVVPGITAATGCATYAGIPLTHRDHAQSCAFVTGHLKNYTIDLNWKALATPNQTVVIYMGLTGLPEVCTQLIAHGVSADMPIALVEQGTSQKQRVFVATLATMNDEIKNKDVHAPTLIIVGTVVNLREKLNWFGTSAT